MKVSSGQHCPHPQRAGDLVTWCDDNFLELNITKTEEMVIDFRLKPGSIEPLVIKGEEVRIVDCYKYLGTVIDHKLEWTPQIDLCCKKASQRLFFLRKLRQFKVSGSVLFLFYQSTIRSVLLFNQLCFFSSAGKMNVERMNSIVSTASRVIGADITPLSDTHQ